MVVLGVSIGACTEFGSGGAPIAPSAPGTERSEIVPRFRLTVAPSIHHNL
jgi:hypothetical protein